jgi:hypothetical protein
MAGKTRSKSRDGRLIKQDKIMRITWSGRALPGRLGQKLSITGYHKIKVKPFPRKKRYYNSLAVSDKTVERSVSE